MTRWILTGVLAGSIASTGCSMAQLRVYEACRDAPGSPGCMAAQREVEFEREHEKQMEHKRSQWQQADACRLRGGEWSSGGYGNGVDGLCIEPLPAVAQRAGVDRGFYVSLQIQHGAVGGATSPRTSPRGSWCRADARDDMRAAIVLSPYDTPGGVTQLFLKLPDGTVVTHEIDPIDGSTWSTRLAASDEEPAPGWHIERLKLSGDEEGGHTLDVTRTGSDETVSYVGCPDSWF